MEAADPFSTPDAITAELVRRNPALAAELGVTLPELAALMAMTATLAQAEADGWISAEERRLYQAEANPADLRAMGYGETEANAILEEQWQDLAHASSS
jgi:hypothetical protein